ncbi:MAG: hypothetical protein MI742_03690, partial [Desulfobacterales bacterium]|nr:hypothetical protein [Desulfobacterales bacterium]
KTYFVQLEQKTPFGALTFKTEKLAENEKNQNKDDKDGYLVGLTAEAAGFTFQPAVYLVKDRAPKKDTDNYKFILPISGKIGAIELTSEFIVSSEEKYVAATNKIEDGTVFGAWIDAATTVGGVSYNASLFYSGTDDGFALSDEGANLCPMEILGDDITLTGATLFRVKASKSITDKIGVDASAAYMFTNFDDEYKVNNFKTADLDSAYEINTNATFKASDAVTLTCGVAYLDGEEAYKKNDLTKLRDRAHARTDAYVKIHVAF